MTKESIKSFEEFNIKNELKNTEVARGYLEEALQEYFKTGDSQELLHCLKPLIQSQGSISQFSQRSNINRTYLYKLFNNQIKPDFNTLLKIINSLGFSLKADVKKIA
jgi:probable addiction module antidote protein